MPPNTSEEKAFLKYFGQHLVAICGSYVTVDDKGKRGQPKFYSYTGTVFEICGKWVLATAGHCLESLENASNDPQVLIETEVLADYFGPSATNQTPLPFKPLEQGFLYVNEDGLDFGFVFISDLWRECLARNKVIPFTTKQWNFPAGHQFDSYGIVGFPDKFTGNTPSVNLDKMIGHVRPTFLPIMRLPNDQTKKFERFKGELTVPIDKKIIKGMSGGPIVGFFREDDQNKYLLQALQSSWGKKSIVFGCPIRTMMEFLEEKMQEYVRNSRTAKTD
jgi:hypothetical protein